MSVILITGCSTGIGFATAEKLARNSNTVYATMRHPGKNPALKKLAEEQKLRINILKMDVNDTSSVQETIEIVLKKEGRIDVLVNNAGIHTWGAIEELPLEKFHQEMETNFFGPIRCIKAVLPAMREKRSGTIINISSIAGELYSNFHGTYAPSKAALEALSESLAQEVQPFNIKVFLVQPGMTETPIFAKTANIPANTNYPNIKRFLSMFAASLEYHVPADTAAEVVQDIVDGTRHSFRNHAGPFADGFLQFRSSLTDEDWINSVGVDDETWISGMEQMGLQVRKYMTEPELPHFGKRHSVITGQVT